MTYHYMMFLLECQLCGIERCAMKGVQLISLLKCQLCEGRKGKAVCRVWTSVIIGLSALWGRKKQTAYDVWIEGISEVSALWGRKVKIVCRVWTSIVPV